MRHGTIVASCFFSAFLAAAPCVAQTANDSSLASPQQIASMPTRSSPDWVKSAVIYQIFPREFTQQGNLRGVLSRMDDMQKLGVDILWLMPIHPHGELKKKGSLGSDYSVRDYSAIDPALGTKDDLHALVKEAHARHMRVILDMVANHTAWDSVMMKHPEFYRKDKQGNITSPYDWTDVAALDYSNPALRKYMTDALIYWVKEFDIDGYRCDAAGEVPTSFWNEARTALDKVKPDIVMLAEASKPDLMLTAFNLDYAWPGMHSLETVIMRGAPATEIMRNWEEQREQYPKGTLHMRMTDDHDELRAVTRFSFPGAIAAWSVVATLDGTPLIYNGMEVGDSQQTSAPALFEPGKIFWQAADWHKDYLPFFTTMTTLRHQHPALQQGETTWIHNSDEQHVVSFTRTAGPESFLVVVNLSNTPFRGSVEAAGAGWKEDKLPGFDPASAALPAVSLPAFGVRIFERQMQ